MAYNSGSQLGTTDASLDYKSPYRCTEGTYWPVHMRVCGTAQFKQKRLCTGDSCTEAASPEESEQLPSSFPAASALSAVDPDTSRHPGMAPFLCPEPCL